jgi:hypothetical protein
MNRNRQIVLAGHSFAGLLTPGNPTDVREMPTSHCPFLSEPDQLARIFAAALRRCLPASAITSSDHLSNRANRAVPDWQATPDALQKPGLRRHRRPGGILGHITGHRDRCAPHRGRTQDQRRSPRTRRVADAREANARRFPMRGGTRPDRRGWQSPRR